MKKLCIVYLVVVRSLAIRTQLLISLKTFLHFYKDQQIDIYVITNDNSLQSCFNFGNCKFLTINIQTVKERCFSLQQQKFIDGLDDFTKITIYKTAIPCLDFFYKYENVLYVDTDTMFMSNKLNEMLDIQVQAEQIVAVDEECFGQITHIRYDWLQLDHHYINSGVMLFKQKNFNSDIAHKCIDKFVDLYKSDERYHQLIIDGVNVAEQSLINKVYKIKAVSDYRFNNYFGNTIKIPIINHYIGVTKNDMIYVFSNFVKLNYQM